MGLHNQGQARTGAPVDDGFTSADIRATLQWMCIGGWAPDAADAEQVLPGVGDVLRRCWCENPDERMTAASLCLELRQLARGVDR